MCAKPAAQWLRTQPRLMSLATAATPLLEQSPGAPYGAAPAEWLTFAPFGEHGCTSADTSASTVYAVA